MVLIVVAALKYLLGIIVPTGEVLASYSLNLPSNHFFHFTQNDFAFKRVAWFSTQVWLGF
jgi:hypothetical protein